MKSICGTPATMAPELFRRIPYNEKCDIWSLGVIIFYMLFGYYPFKFNYNDPVLCLDSILKTKIEFPTKSNVSEEAISLIQSMLIIDAN